MRIKLDLVQKISLAGILLALVIIFTRFLSFQNIPVIPFVRISLGPALIIFSSILLGPFFGAIVGGLSDILGIVLVPNALGYGINPWFTAVYALLGIIPGLLIYLFEKVNSDKALKISLVAFLSALFIFTTVFLLINNDITLFGKNYVFEIWHKVLIIALAFNFSVGTVIGIHFLDIYFKHRNQDGCHFFSIYKVTIISIIDEFLVLLILNSIVKAYFFETDFLVIFFSQCIVFFINIMLDAFVVTNLLNLMKKVIKERKKDKFDE